MNNSCHFLQQEGSATTHRLKVSYKRHCDRQDHDSVAFPPPISIFHAILFLKWLPSHNLIFAAEIEQLLVYKSPNLLAAVI